jgi:hypothetical protein
MIDIVCRCGHYFFKHQRDNAKDMYCNTCWDELDINSVVMGDMYHEYQSDNLMYIELLAKEKGLI